MMAAEWNPAQFHDSYRADLLRLIEERAAQPEGVAVAAAAPADDAPPRVLDLMAALKGSLAARAQASRRAGSGKTGKVVKRSTVTAATAKAAPRSRAHATKASEPAARGSKRPTPARKRA
jgi:DNA end-binding protein Ku